MQAREEQQTEEQGKVCACVCAWGGIGRLTCAATFSIRLVSLASLASRF